MRPSCAQNAPVGGPWDFDTNDEGFRSGITPGSRAADTDTDGCSNWGEDRNWNNVLDSGENQAEPWSTSGLDQNWSTAGGCGFMTGTSATQGGIWHTGHIGAYNNNGGVACRPNESICEQYDTNNGTAGPALLGSSCCARPSIHPISLGPDDADGFEWRTQILDWAWNMQIDLDGTGTRPGQLEPSTSTRPTRWPSCWARTLAGGTDLEGAASSRRPANVFDGGHAFASRPTPIPASADLR